MSNYKLVYSTDPVLNKKCPNCKELVVECRCVQLQVMPEKITAVLRLEKAKRGGKTVTVIAKLPGVEKYVAALAKELKNKFGCGGTHGIEGIEGYIELQGDRRDALRPLLAEKKITVKG